MDECNGYTAQPAEIERIFNRVLVLSIQAHVKLLKSWQTEASVKFARDENKEYWTQGPQYDNGAEKQVVFERGFS